MGTPRNKRSELVDAEFEREKARNLAGKLYRLAQELASKRDLGEFDDELSLRNLPDWLKLSPARRRRDTNS